MADSLYNLSKQFLILLAFSSTILVVATFVVLYLDKIAEKTGLNTLGSKIDTFTMEWVQVNILLKENGYEMLTKKDYKKFRNMLAKNDSLIGLIDEEFYDILKKMNTEVKECEN